jgi:hypothetical protein
LGVITASMYKAGVLMIGHMRPSPARRHPARRAR